MPLNKESNQTKYILRLRRTVIGKFLLVIQRWYIHV